MTSASATHRAEVDRCPGVLRPHRAADGALLRLRLPGGQLPAQTLDIVNAAAARYADGDVQLTSRANLQLRGVATDERGAVHPGLLAEIVRAGLLPHPSHERVRNIVCSPLTGRRGGAADLRPLLRDLDARLCSTPALAALPGPFLIVLDDGRGDVATLAGDLGVVAVDQRTVTVLLGGLPSGLVLPLAETADELISLALRFLRFTTVSGGQTPWRIREMPGRGKELLADEMSESFADVPVPATSAAAGFGEIQQDDGRVLISTLVPLGLLNHDQTAALVRAAGRGAGELIVTPWRGVVVPDLPPTSAASIVRDLAAVGLAVDDGTPWRGLTACTGAPRCASGQGETRSLATQIARSRGSGAASVMAPAVHVVGCDRRCGAPSGPHIEVLTTGDGVVVRGVDGGDSSSAPVGPDTTPAAVVRETAAVRAALDTVRAGGAVITRPPRRYAYCGDGVQIYRESFAMIRAESDLSQLPPDAEKVAVRMVHACGQTDLTADLSIHPDLVRAARTALRDGAPIFTDATMVASGGPARARAHRTR